MGVRTGFSAFHSLSSCEGMYKSLVNCHECFRDVFTYIFT